MFGADERGQSIQVGAVLLFAILIIAFSTHQAVVIPNQNARVEANHLQTIDQEMQDLRNAIVYTAPSEKDSAVTLTLGTNYPSRLLGLNPPSPSGSIRTTGTTDMRMNVTIANAVSPDEETGDFWNGSNQIRNTGDLLYTPNYHEYPDPPKLVYDNTMLYRGFGDANLTTTGQQLIDGNQLNLIMLNGSVSRTSSQTTNLHVEPASASENSVQIRSDETDANVTLYIASQRNASSWRSELQEDQQYVDDGGHVVSVRPVSRINQEFTYIAITLEQLPNERTYDLRMAKVGVGTGITDEDRAYLTASSEGGDTLGQEENTTFVVEARDPYNNPVSDVLVNATAGSGTIEPADRTGSDGHATFEYQAPSDDTGDIFVNFSYLVKPGSSFQSNTTANVSMKVDIREGGRTNTQSPYTLQWDTETIETESGVSDCYSSNQTCIYDLSADTSDSGDMTLTATITNPSMSFVNVDFSANDSSVVTNLDPSSGETDESAVVTTTASISQPGEVSLLAASTADSDAFVLRVLNSGPPPATFDSLTAEVSHSRGGETEAQEVTFNYGLSSDASGVDLEVVENSGRGPTTTGTGSGLSDSSQSETVGGLGSDGQPSDNFDLIVTADIQGGGCQQATLTNATETVSLSNGDWSAC